MHSLDGNFQPADASKVPIFHYLYNFKPIEKICVKKLGNKDKNFRRSSTLNCIYQKSVVITRRLEVKKFNITIITFALVRYEIVVANLVRSTSLAIYHLTSITHME